jgi:hypothetical protein
MSIKIIQVTPAITNMNFAGFAERSPSGQIWPNLSTLPAKNEIRNSDHAFLYRRS